jgi:hypothetical protein
VQVVFRNYFFDPIFYFLPLEDCKLRKSGKMNSYRHFNQAHPMTLKTDHPIQPVLAQRWSPYSFDDRPVPEADLPRKPLREFVLTGRWGRPSPLVADHQ